MTAFDETLCNRRHKGLWLTMSGTVASVAVVAAAVGWVLQQHQEVSKIAANVAMALEQEKARTEGYRSGTDITLASIRDLIRSMDDRQSRQISVIDERQQRVLERLNQLVGELKGKSMASGGSGIGGEGGT